jgi:DNA mismatch repair protein MutL
MATISVLPEILINKIAAGEVIDRPASVVRELIDNSIDAGATQINIDVLHGGKKLIKVSDNGQGMDIDDARLCFERHATSKIVREDDLFDITTLGFRGEALPAIASISKVILISSTANATAGVKVEIEANNKINTSDAPMVQGTAIEIRDIFYNTPARKKFLKTNPTELSHIIETVTQKAFTFPGISFSLIHNNKEILDVPVASDLKERFKQIYGEEFTNEFLEFKTTGKIINLTGFCSSVNFTRASRSHQFIFVNNRPVKNPTINHAVYSAYSNIIPKDKHPAYFLFLDIDPKIVDVNVHPAKREVRFERPDEIHSAVSSTVYETLNPRSSVRADVASYTDASGSYTSQDFRVRTQDMPVVSETAQGFMKDSQTDIFRSGITPDVSVFYYIGEAFIARTSVNGLEIIDQHAAHERILYERFLNKTFIETDTLFLPLRIELPAKEYNLIIRNKNMLNGLGLDIEDFGNNNIIVRAIPKELKKAEINELLLDIASGILEEETSGIKGELTAQSILNKIAATMACHKSVRGSEPLNNEELTAMMSDLEKTEAPDRCPHGRPTRISLSMDDLNKMFKRK